MKPIYYYLEDIDLHRSYAQVHNQMDNQVSEKILIIRGRRQGDPISPKLFTTTIHEVFKNAQLEQKGTNIDG